MRRGRAACDETKGPAILTLSAANVCAGTGCLLQRLRPSSIFRSIRARRRQKQTHAFAQQPSAGFARPSIAVRCFALLGLRLGMLAMQLCARKSPATIKQSHDSHTLAERFDAALRVPTTRACKTHILWPRGSVYYPLPQGHQWGMPDTDLFLWLSQHILHVLGMRTRDTKIRVRIGQGDTRPSSSTSSK